MDKIHALLDELTNPYNEIDIVRNVVRPTIIRAKFEGLGLEDTIINVVRRLIENNQDLLELELERRREENRKEKDLK